ncbi:MAG: primosomal protein N' [Betaproteobacteria bacterium]
MPIARVALPVAASSAFDYWIPEGAPVQRGSVVRVALGPRRMIGIVSEIAATTTVAQDKLQTLSDVVDVPPLPDDVMALAAFVAAYYQEPVGQALALAVPPLTKGKPRKTRRVDASADASDAGAVTVAFNPEQQSAIDAIDAAHTVGFVPFLLFGVTGSGKTDVYMAAAKRVIARGGQVLLLVPEINLTPQLTQRLGAALPGVAIALLHSALTPSARRAHWVAAASGHARLVVGTRLAIFAPLPDLQLVIVDEEQDSSYKQQENIRYHARDAAVWRAHHRDVPIVLGSATPSLESWLHVREHRYRRLDLRQRADTRATLPIIRLVDNRAARDMDGIGADMRAAIALRLDRQEQSLIFVNRRGYSPSLNCASCGWDAQCTRCSARLTVHREPPALRCHHCGHIEALPAACPTCGNVDLLPLGYGTQRLERALAEAFPAARIARVDRDSTRARGAFAEVRDKVAANQLDILVGTQMLAKGHDFPRLTLVGVLGADNALYSADFRATERLGALLMQVAGRAGRADLAGEVVVQTDFATHPVYVAVRTHDYELLAATLLAERRIAALPPFTHVALLAAEAHERATVDQFLADAHGTAKALVEAAHPEVELFAPVNALLSRRAGFERAQIAVQCERRAPLQRFLTEWHAGLAGARAQRRVRWAIDVDPAGFG